MVQWSNETTLAEFDVFLMSAFSDNVRELISLKSVLFKRNQLTFVCTIPDWFDDKLTQDVKNNKDALDTMGVITVTIGTDTIVVDKKV